MPRLRLLFALLFFANASCFGVDGFAEVSRYIGILEISHMDDGSQMPYVAVLNGRGDESIYQLRVRAQDKASLEQLKGTRGGEVVNVEVEQITTGEFGFIIPRVLKVSPPFILFGDRGPLDSVERSIARKLASWPLRFDSVSIDTDGSLCLKAPHFIHGGKRFHVNAKDYKGTSLAEAIGDRLSVTVVDFKTTFIEDTAPPNLERMIRRDQDEYRNLHSFRSKNDDARLAEIAAKAKERYDATMARIAADSKKKSGIVGENVVQLNSYLRLEKPASYGWALTEITVRLFKSQPQPRVRLGEEPLVPAPIGP